MFWSLTGGGVRRYLLKKHAWLSGESGWSHRIAVPLAGASPAEPWIHRLPSWPIPRSGGYRLPVDRKAIARVIVRMQPSLIEAADPYRVAWGALDAARQLGVPSVAFCHSNLERLVQMAAGHGLRRAAGAVARHYARRLYNRFDLVLAPSQAMRRHLLDWGVERVVCQPLGVDCSAFTAFVADTTATVDGVVSGPSSRSAWRRAHGFTESQRILVFAGRFAPEKNLDVLAAAVGSLGAPYVLLAIGAGPKPPPVSAHVRTLPFMSNTADLAAAFASADAFVHAGDQETFGLSVLEAMACGLPVVVRAAEGLAEMVDANVGIAVAAGTPQAFAEAITALFDKDIAAMGHAARKLALANDWNVVLPTLVARYRALIDAGPDQAPSSAAVSPVTTVDLQGHGPTSTATPGTADVEPIAR